jgi:CubicO group peptidase (beta-lactamase class C family)
MEQLRVPGVAFSLIDGGKVVFQGGLGVRELGKAARIDADTLFLAASNTKPMTALLLAQLADEKKLRWDQPVAQIYPGFKLGDPETTRQVLVKHLVCACTGLPRQDLEWLFEFRQATPAGSMALLGTMQPTSRFGEVYQYSNLMAAAAGYIGAAIVAPKRELGAAYDQALRDRIFLPLGMKNTTFDFARVQKGNYARPHGSDVDGKPSPARMDINYSIVPVRPAGGMWTSARDLSRYVQMELAQGKLASGKRLVSQENLLARWTPQVPVSEDVAYGMGLIVDNRWGVQILRHGGSMPGYRSDMMWLPEHGVGAVILTNSRNGGALLAPFLRRLVEVLFDGKSEAAEQLAIAAAQIEASVAKTRERLVIPPDSAEAGKLAAYYLSPALGGLAVRREASALVFDLGEWRSTVASRKNDDGTTSFITIDPTVGRFNFVASARAGKRALLIRAGQHEYAFTEETSP